MNENFELDIVISDPKDKTRLDDAVITIDAAMPAHSHGMLNAPIVERRPDGTFHVSGMLFHMSGHWEFYVDITRDGITERAQADIELE
jgi:hypothetical protein